jgi:hypothetical protein
MVIEDEGDEGQTAAAAAIDRAVMDRIEWAKIDRTEIDRGVIRSEGNSRATRRQRLGGGGKAGVLT